MSLFRPAPGAGPGDGPKTQSATPIPSAAPSAPMPVTGFPKTAQMAFCIGAQKAGTTWLYDFLKRSPQCHFSRNKELHYFDVMAGRADLALDLRVRMAASLAAQLRTETGGANVVALRQLQEVSQLLTIYTGGGAGRQRHAPYLSYMLEGHDAQPVVCDITPSYAVLDRAHFADMAMIGRARFIFILRDPVDRMWSQIRMAQADAVGDHAEACATHARILMSERRLPKLARADYRRTIQELEAAVPADRIHYVFYERLFQRKTTDAICSFLGISPVDPDPARRVNEGRASAIPDDIADAFRKAFAPQYAFIRDRFGSALPDAWLRRGWPGLAR